MRFPYGQTATFTTRTKTGTDDMGQPIYDETQVAVPGCAFNPGGSIELVQGQDTLIVNPRVFVPAGVALPAVVDSVTIGGETYEVDGQPQEWVNPFSGTVFGGVVNLEGGAG